jgi:hypothetical protein
MAEFSELWMIGILLAAFAGGAFGSAIGALPAFIFTGFLVMAGETASIVSGDFLHLFDMEGSDLQSAAITGQIGFGPVFGPHISFAAGAAASAFAAKKGYMNTGFPYHEAKNIAYAQGPKPDVLFVGGLFGILGYWITTLSVALSLPWDPIAVAVVLSAVVHRVVFGYSIIGKAREGLMNMKPFETEERRISAEKPDDENEKSISNRLLVEPWLPHQYKWGDVTMLGFVVGILAAFITYETGSVFLPFGISAASLLFLNLGVANIPVTHHISLVGSTAMVAATGGEFIESSLFIMLLIGGGFGILSALFGELIQRIFYAHADTHFDPPAAAIVMGTFLIAILAVAGILPSSAWVPLPF